MADRGLLIVFSGLQGLEKERSDEKFLKTGQSVSVFCIDDDACTTSR